MRCRMAVVVPCISCPFWSELTIGRGAIDDLLSRNYDAELKSTSVLSTLSAYVEAFLHAANSTGCAPGMNR